MTCSNPFPCVSTEADPLKHPRAFTLIELLVVISIISLLIAILLPSLRAARVASQRTVSVSNIRQITVALHNYASDYRDSMPIANTWHIFAGSWTINPTGPFWSTHIHQQGYVSSWDVYWSPAKQQDWTTNPETYRRYRQVGYGINQAVSPDGGTHGPGATSPAIMPLRLGEASAPPPSKMLILAETWQNSNLAANPERYAGNWRSSYANNGESMFNYAGSIVRSYVDGHAKAVEGQRGVQVHHAQSQIPPKLAPHPDVLGWDLAAGSVPAGPLMGGWNSSFAARNEYAPWYLNWRTTWTDTLRPF